MAPCQSVLTFYGQDSDCYSGEQLHLYGRLSHPHPRILTISVLISAQIFGGVLKNTDSVFEEFKLNMPRR
jgi:hypothetical protein